MGGRGASSGFSYDREGNPKYKYGTEYSTVLQSGRIKFVKYNMASNAKSPMETMTKGRIYVTLGKNGEPQYITRYDKSNKRYKQIDITGKEHIIDGKKTLPHTHLGYNHSEYGTFNLSKSDKELIDRVKRIWNNYKNK